MKTFAIAIALALAACESIDRGELYQSTDIEVEDGAVEMRAPIMYGMKTLAESDQRAWLDAFMEANSLCANGYVVTMDEYIYRPGGTTGIRQYRATCT